MRYARVALKQAGFAASGDPSKLPREFQQEEPLLRLEAWRYYLRGRLARWLRQPARAADNYRLALRFDPTFARAAHALAFLLVRERRHEDAAQLLRDVVRRQPGNAQAWFNLGYVCDQLAQPQEAVAAFSEAVRLAPKLDQAWYGLGLCQRRAGQHREAVRAFETATRLQSMNPHAWYELGMTFHALAQGEDVRHVIEQLNRFDRKMTRQLIQDTGRSDLAHLVADYIGR